MKPILRNLIDIDVGYLSLNRGVGTLSGGEFPRVKMARQLARAPSTSRTRAT
jgi:excinuclease UvrABC ATPase subunit